MRSMISAPGWSSPDGAPTHYRHSRPGSTGSDWWGRLSGLYESGWFAVFPYDPVSGFAEFRTNLGSGLQISGHDQYFKRRSEALRNMARIVTGNSDDVSRWG